MSARAEPAGIRALVCLYCPPPAGAVFRALDAIEGELTALLAPRLEHTGVHARLAWWREECARTMGGTPEHPLTRSLAHALAAAGSCAAPELTGLIDNTLWDLAAAPFADEPALEGYAGRWAGAFMRPLAAALGADAGPAVTCGTQLRRLELLLQLRGEALVGRVRLPLDALGPLDAGELCRPRWPDELSERVQAAHARSRSALAATVRALGGRGGAALRPLRVWASLLDTHARHAARRLPRADTGRPIAGVLDGWRAWRAARGTLRQTTP
ncbi:MAG: squalene/phytoene synthase family protein [Gammaproteobacteria bacterium]|nr:squalene/phytoene synthase family protein [Gammaproteobacteria bacterium]